MKAERPFRQRQMAAFHDAPDRDRKSLIAGIAVMQSGAMALAAEAIDLVNLAAMRAIGTVWPAELFEVLAGFIFVVENWAGEIDFGHGSPRC